MPDIASDAPQAIGYVSHGICMTQMTEQHANKMGPAINTLAILIRSMFPNNIAKHFSGDDTCNL
jgi:hypothetical protein